MDRMYLIGDVHTVTVFRMGGVEGVVSRPETVADDLESVVRAGDAGIVIVTRELADHVRDKIADINFGLVRPVIVEIPGIRDQRGFGKSIMSYITEALGISVEGKG